ncbi:glutathione S-transferase N-terminal domain-containing protein [Microbulbifer sp. EKSA008]|uniref:glutathione S-transferase N-terminal domain-containing protein n=1 Tax=unclassified Microbulbifer TaxID=2619833 RepID=UPI000D52EB81|nr:MULTISPECIES: glutathione S-transferase N-terminal domain-containing protein [unclassified Microbulbifer]AWF82390.1 stringent starvation protein A [Microbulbifer sp. A4B17]WHI48304.1 glutathione S-transferase N-terminal domain-containing protein [Microbulbifer sp. VAAF005]WNZ55368.1 glutathione S-transferase N-terminal domain-containing protein [Microbulbifer sp. MKSA007]
MGVPTNKRSSMTFFSDGRSHYSHRVRIVLAEKGVSVDITDVDADDKPAELADLNPYNSLPTLVDRDLVLFETKVMMEYLDERFPHPPLLPVYPVARAQSRQIMHRIERDWCPLVDKILAGGKDAASARKELRDNLVGIAPMFTDLPYFFNEEFSLVDCCMAPLLWRLEQFEISLPKTKQVKPLLDYMDRLFAREAFQQSLTEYEREMR